MTRNYDPNGSSSTMTFAFADLAFDRWNFTFVKSSCRESRSLLQNKILTVETGRQLGGRSGFNHHTPYDWGRIETTLRDSCHDLMGPGRQRGRESATKLQRRRWSAVNPETQGKVEAEVS